MGVEYRIRVVPVAEWGAAGVRPTERRFTDRTAALMYARRTIISNPKASVSAFTRTVPKWEACEIPFTEEDPE
jgi:hypothetical protein